ncbi:uncharacterized protein LOC133039330 [Cannabis sativa]|uniref:uncharacterized protein LOC133039330 n=1 Tax=Cannabis sativa TaxID=3483 RepID=UPI0029CA6279|nr:uncharacterized protein LOC133039330 [Cannabis sativa]
MAKKTNFFVAFVYGFNDEVGRRDLWGDERIGSNVRCKNSSEFWDYVNECHLKDVKYPGNFYTWCNKQIGDERIYSKIDRVLANPTWLNLHHTAEVIFQNEGLFDHSLAVLTIFTSPPGGKKPFRYSRMWSSHPVYRRLVQSRWQEIDNGTKMYQVVSKLKGLKPLLKQLNKQFFFFDLPAANAKAKEDLDACQSKLHQNPLNNELQSIKVAARKEYATIQAAYISFLQQKAKLL